MAKSKVLTKEEKIKKERNRLKRALKEVDKNKLNVVSPLIDQVAFMAVSLSELQAEIDEEGYTVEYQNGKDQFGTKQSDAVKTHLTMQKNFTAAIKVLAELAPPAKKKSTLAEMRGE